MKTIETLAGTRRIDTARSMIETATGTMVAYIRVEIKHIDGKQCFALMVDEVRGVAVAADTWRSFLNEGKTIDPNWNDRAFTNVMSEGYGDY